MDFKDYINEIRSYKKIGKTKNTEVDKLVKRADDIIKQAESKLDDAYGKYTALRNVIVFQGNKGEYDTGMIKSFLDNLEDAVK
tara:strand:+ start:406 stop:654 length:249 start_codon:yes stop_codon:yes gene_type:complete